MYLYLYSRSLRLICFLLLAVTLLWALLRRKALPHWRTINRVLFWMALFSVLWITVFSRTPGIHSLVLLPFRTFYAAKQQPELYRELLMNILLFLPLGLTLPYWFRRKSSPAGDILRTIRFCILLSVGIECLQYWFALGYSEADDVLFNTLGGALGTSHRYLADLIPTHRRDPHASDKS